MSTALLDVPATDVKVVTSSSDNVVTQHVESLLGEKIGQYVGVDRRRSRRRPYPYPIHLTPVAGNA